MEAHLPGQHEDPCSPSPLTVSTMLYDIVVVYAVQVFQCVTRFNRQKSWELMKNAEKE